MKKHEDSVFRLAQPEDIPQVLALFFGAVKHMCENGIQQWDEIYPDETILTADIQSGQMYLLEDKGELAAAVVLNTEQPPEYRAVKWQYHPEPVAVIHRLCVVAAKQGNGYGSEMLRRSEDFLRQQGYRCIRLDAFPQNPSAIHMYESAGYRHSGEMLVPRKGIFNCYEKPLEPVVIESEGT